MTCFDQECKEGMLGLWIPGLKMTGSVSFPLLELYCQAVRKSRLDWLEAMQSEAQREGPSWTFWASQPPGWEQSRREQLARECTSHQSTPELSHPQNRENQHTAAGPLSSGVFCYTTEMHRRNSVVMAVFCFISWHIGHYASLSYLWSTYSILCISSASQCKICLSWCAKMY